MPRRPVPLALARLLALACCLALLPSRAPLPASPAYAAQIVPDIVASFPAPGNRASALAWGDGSLWLADVDRTLYRLAPDGSVQASATITMTASDLAWGENSLWAHDGARVYRLDSAGRAVETLGVGYWPSSGLEWADGALYVGDYNLGTIHRHSRAGQHLLSWDTSFFGHPTGIAYDGAGLWLGGSCEGGNNLYRYTLLGQQTDSIDLTSIGITCDARQTTDSLAWDGQYLWYTADDKWTVYRLDLSPLPAPRPAAISPNSAPANAGAVQVTISGANFRAPAAVRLDDVPLADVVVESATTLRASVPVGSLSQGAYDLAVTSGGKTGVLAGAFTVRPPAIVPEPTEDRWEHLPLDGGIFYDGMIGFVAVDPGRPEVIYAAERSGTTADQLFRSSDGGATWRIFLDDFRATLVAVAPEDSRIIYAPRSSGSFAFANKSVDDGQTWKETPCCGLGTIEAIVPDPRSPGTVYTAMSRYATNDPGVYKTTNGGTSWTRTGLHLDALGVAVDPTNGAVLYAAVATTDDVFERYIEGYGGIYKSSDAGITWTHVFSHTRVNAVVVNPLDPRVVYAATEGGGVFTSSDGGARWARANSGLGGLFVRALAIDPANPRVLYAGLWEGGVFRSVDSGASWRSINAGLTHTSIMALAVDPQQPQVVYAGTRGGGLFKWRGPAEILGPHARVTDPQGNPVIGAEVYHNGALVVDERGRPRLTNSAGDVPLPGLRSLDTLVAVLPHATAPTDRPAHDGWASRTATTSLVILPDGRTAAHRVVDETGRQPLVVRDTGTLIAFNLVVSLEWDADDAAMTEIADAFRKASDYLFDITDGQMVFGRVAIYDRRQHWTGADVQVAANNIVQPHANIGGIDSTDGAHVIRIGRAWDGNTGATGPWTAPDGYRTIVHEFGHYGLFLWDSYLRYSRDAEGNLTMPEFGRSCTGPENHERATDATNASIMDYQYTSSELAMRRVPGLWSAHCEETAQYQINKESDWETLLRRYRDTATPPRWRIITPEDRGGVLAGPDELPDVQLNLPGVSITNGGVSNPPIELLVVREDGTPQTGAIVALYPQSRSVISQGLTDGAGRLLIYGALAGDRLRAATLDGALAGLVQVGQPPEQRLTLTLRPFADGLKAQGQAPHLRVAPNGGTGPDDISLLVELRGFNRDDDPVVLVTLPGSQLGATAPLVYSPPVGGFTGRVSFSGAERGSGSVWAAVTIAGQRTVQLHTTYRLQHVVGDQPQDVFSDDGNLSLHLDAGSLDAQAQTLVVAPMGALPGPPPDGLALVGSAYDIAASGALPHLLRPGALRLRDDAQAAGRPRAAEGLALYWWNPHADVLAWQPVPTSADEAHGGLAASVTALGVYALFAPRTSLEMPWRQHLPLAQR